ncbi:MAG: hypothetical protein CMJ64_10480 [Planctomycetaceae bacterium]|nr:hypothetical protein [Planctomycetaceae bacterium]
MIRVGSFLLVVLVGHNLAAQTPKRQFDTKIAPLLASRCLECHSGPEPKGGLDLSNRERAIAGGENGVSIVARKPDESPLWKRIEADEMPPKHPLPKSEKEMLRKWIAEGAVWGTSTIDPFQFTSDSRGGYDWWSLQPLQEIAPPKVKQTEWLRSDLDNFILHQLERNELTPSQPADPRALVRRLYFDLLGLPPAPEVIDTFVNDPSDAAYDKLVNDLLESPHYGERWGRHWLDVARYGESDGFERNNVRKNIWHYRDWVIKALNDDMPYDEFVRKQLAGDIVENGKDGAAAVGFLVAGVHNTVVGGSKRMKLLARQDELEEVIGAVGQTFLGLTVNCARCHDHKFDPIRMEEYYSMIAAIDGVNHGEREIPRPEIAPLLADASENLKDLNAKLNKTDITARAKILEERKKNAGATPKPDRPQPYVSWEFEGDLKDSIGKLHGKAVGNARVENGALVVDGASFVETGPLDKDLAEKTLEAWVLLDNLEQRGGGCITVQTMNGGVFDAIVFGEREPKRWMAGSNGFVRTKSFAGTEEAKAAAEPVHFAIVYREDGTITGYRNGLQYGSPYKTGFQRFKAGESQMLFGLRHKPANGNHFLTGRILRASLYDRALTPEAVAASAGVESSFISEKVLIASLSEEERQQRADLRAKIDAATKRLAELDAQAKEKVYTVAAGKPGAMRVHIRGSVTDYGDEVAPGAVNAIAGVEGSFGLAKDAADADRRRKLAEWITHESNPLFARVIVNRVWHYHFGTGLVDTPNDLGFNGGRPSHPELIDWLANQLTANDYRLKALHRLIVTSATYRQSSAMNQAAPAKDAGNRLLWRYAPRRIEAEVLRDAMLQVAGVLNPKRGGEGFEDVKIVPNNGTTYYEPFDPEGEAFNRRTVYRFTPRGGRSAVLDSFDCPDPSSAAPRRSVTTTPLQALSLLNNSFVLRMADHFASRVEKEAGKDTVSQVERAWQVSLGRRPNDNEKQLSAELVSKHGLASLCRALFNSNEFVVIQ